MQVINACTETNEIIFVKLDLKLSAKIYFVLLQGKPIEKSKTTLICCQNDFALVTHIRICSPIKILEGWCMGVRIFVRFDILLDIFFPNCIIFRFFIIEISL